MNDTAHSTIQPRSRIPWIGEEVYQLARENPKIDQTVAALMRYLGPFVRSRNRVTGTLDPQPFFIVGSGRSGNTLLRRMLGQSHQVHIPPETFVLGGVVRLYETNRHQPWPVLVRLILSTFEYHAEFEHFEIGLRDVYQALRHSDRERRSLSHVIDALYRYHGETVGASFQRWGDKTPLNAYHLERIFRVFPGAQFVHIIRDGLDVAHSYVRAGLLDTIDDACTRWSTSVRAIERFASQHPDSVLEISYEALVTNPEVTLRSVCSFLNLTFESSFLELPDRSLGDVEAYSHHSRVLEAVATDRVGAGRRGLSAAQLATISKPFWEQLRRSGYPLPEVAKHR